MTNQHCQSSDLKEAQSTTRRCSNGILIYKSTSNTVTVARTDLMHVFLFTLRPMDQRMIL